MASYLTSNEAFSMVTDDGDLVGMIGITRTDDPLVAVPWMLCTDRLPEFSKTLIKLSKQWVIEQNKIYSILMNYVDARNSTSIQCLNIFSLLVFRREVSEKRGPIKGHSTLTFLSNQKLTSN